jgi:hypothetical protein
MNQAPPPWPLSTPTSPGGACNIYSGQWQMLPAALDYRAAMLGDILAERLVWGPANSAAQLGNLAIAGPGYIWFRFWLTREQQVVEKYFDAQGQALGMHIHVCMPLIALPPELCVGLFADADAHSDGYCTTDLLLRIWIAADGRVTVRNEAAFEQAIHSGDLTTEEVAWAEERVRMLTSAIALGRFPPALVRNWQVDVQRVQETLSSP